MHFVSEAWVSLSASLIKCCLTLKQKNLKIADMYILYNIILFAAAIIILPYFLLKIIFTGKYRKSFIQKLGGRQAKILADLKDGPRVWIHAVSVGEVTAAAPIVASLKMKRPEVEIIFSTSTETGQEMARKVYQGRRCVYLFSSGYSYIVRKMIKLAKPDVFVLVETELWPNFLRVLRSAPDKNIDG
jgi:3-deoxy-D-manno-octulosonic-acid transferase